jgi:uncharacterized OsmC-like protein
MSTTVIRATPVIVNGIDTTALLATVQAIEADRGLGVCRFQARNRWLAGNHNRTTVTGFFGARQDIAHAQAFAMDADEPAILAGRDQAANPVEHLLHALASCLTTSMVAHAAVRGIEIEELESELEGDLDLSGFLGIDPEAPRGYTSIRITFRARGTSDQLARLRELAQFSPVFNSLVRGVPVDVRVEAR